MKVLISGSSKGIGRAAALDFLKKGHKVVGIDKLPSSIEDENYSHLIADVRDFDKLPVMEDVEILFVNAGVQNEDDIEVNLKGAINVTKKYAFQKAIKAVLFNASASALSGQEFAEYAASKAGLVGYMKNVAIELAKFGAVVNAICLGGVITDSNKVVMENRECWRKIMKATPLKKWMSLNEVCDWVYFLTVKNKSMSGQALLIDNGEMNLNSTFIWPR